MSEPNPEPRDQWLLRLGYTR